MERRNWWFCTTRPLMMNTISWWLHSLIYSLTGAYFDLDFNGHSLRLPSTILCPWQVDTQDEAIKTLTGAKERLEKEKYKLGKSCFVTRHCACATHQASTGLGDKPRAFRSGDRLQRHEDMGTGHNDNSIRHQRNSLCVHQKLLKCVALFPLKNLLHKFKPLWTWGTCRGDKGFYNNS